MAMNNNQIHQGELNKKEPRNEINMDLEYDGTNHNLTESTTRSHDVPGTSSELRHPSIN